MGNQNAKKREGYGLNVRGLFGGMSFLNGKKDKAHAMSECIGNKSLINFCECFDCNHLFGESAELLHLTLPEMFILETL